MDNLIKNIKTVEDRDLALTNDKIPKEMKLKLRKLPIIHITLAIKPTDGILEQIDAFLYSKAGKKILIDWSVDEAILGGANIIFRGKYGNYSIAKNI